MIVKVIMFVNERLVLACDGQCDKAWGINGRPYRQLSDDPDDIVYRPDSELEKAPADPGTRECGHAKPLLRALRLNKWCARECERSVLVRECEDFALPNLNLPKPNMPRAPRPRG